MKHKPRICYMDMRYTYEQGLVKRRLKFEELFHHSTLELKEETA